MEWGQRGDPTIQTVTNDISKSKEEKTPSADSEEVDSEVVSEVASEVALEVALAALEAWTTTTSFLLVSEEWEAWVEA